MNNILTSLLIISVFENVIKDKVVSLFTDFLSVFDNKYSFEESLESYTAFISGLYKKSPDGDLYEYIKTLIYTDENILSKNYAAGKKVNDNILKTAEYELSIMDTLLMYDYKSIKMLFKKKFPSQAKLIEHLPEFYTENFHSPFDIQDILKSYKKTGYGIFSLYNAFKYTGANDIKPVKNFNAPKFSDLKNYDYQKGVIKKNTSALIKGKETNNILLYGDRGCGKSSTVKALINEFRSQNLKIIQVYKDSIIYLDDLFEKIRDLPCKFIIFADDISYDEDDKNFSSIKAVLEGSLADKPDNAVIYATTNRIHMVRESFSSREGDEVHRNDTIDESVSLSDRFGIVLTFSLLTKAEYLDIVVKIAKDYGIKKSSDLLKKAEEFSALKGIRTPRVAKQFVTDYISSEK